jgi:hypothetical protein
MDVFAAIVEGAREESDLWYRVTRSSHARERVAVFSDLAPDNFALGLETIYEAYLVHYGRPRLFDPAGLDEAVLLGDYLYAHGLVRIAAAGGVDAVAVMAALISRCTAEHAQHGTSAGDAWVDAARALGGRPSADDVTRALGRHGVRVTPC